MIGIVSVSTDSQTNVSSVLVGPTDKLGDFLCGLDELVRLPGVRRIVDVSLKEPLVQIL